MCRGRSGGRRKAGPGRKQKARLISNLFTNDDTVTGDDFLSFSPVFPYPLLKIFFFSTARQKLNIGYTKHPVAALPVSQRTQREAFAGNTAFLSIFCPGNFRQSYLKKSGHLSAALFTPSSLSSPTCQKSPQWL